MQFETCTASSLTYWYHFKNWSTLLSQLGLCMTFLWPCCLALVGYVNSFFFCWAFPFIISIKEVKPSNVFCCSADFGFFFKKIEESWFFIIEGSGESRWDGKIPVSTRIPEPNTLGCWEVWGTLEYGPSTFRALLMY